MKLVNVDGRLVLETNPGRGIDIATTSEGRFGPAPLSVLDAWEDFRSWASELPATVGDDPIDPSLIGAPVPLPRQVFGIAANYKAHAAEAGVAPPKEPLVFTKFPTCITGPSSTVELPSDYVDWEVELVVVIGTRADHVAEADAWGCVAGLTVGQDISERVLQMKGAMPQMSMAKSLRGFGPCGPRLVTPDEFADPDDLALGCSVNGQQMQSSRTSDLIFSVSRLVSDLSALCPLLPGDLIFTGTPEGVGATRRPRLYLQAGDVLDTWVEGIGELRNEMVDAAVRFPPPKPRRKRTAEPAGSAARR